MADDFNLTYTDVEKILGRTERTIQRYVKRGKLEVRKVVTSTGEQAFFSQAQVEKLKKELDRQAPGDNRSDTVTRQLVQYEAVLSVFQNQMRSREQKLDEQEKEIRHLVQQLGKLEGKIENMNDLKRELQEVRRVNAIQSRRLQFQTGIFVFLIAIGLTLLLILVLRLA